MANSMGRILMIVSITVNSGKRSSADFNVCDRVFRAMSSERITGEETPSPIDINYCINEIEPAENFKCTFDASTCDNTCDELLGYETNPLGCQTSCKCKVSSFIEEDIKFTKDDLLTIRKAYYKQPTDVEDAAAVGLNIWDQWKINGRVKIPFEMDENLVKVEKARLAIEGAIQAYSQETCIDFVKRTTEPDYIYFTRKAGCWSYIGRRGGKQDVSIGSGCEWNGVVEHELMHALGFWHEQSRPDRDDHVTVMFENVQPGKAHNFKMRASIFSMGSPYDLRSLMQYDGYAFSKNMKPTLVVRDTDQPVLSQREGFSTEDRKQINTLYKCKNYTHINSTKESWTFWGSWTECPVTCGESRQQRSRVCLNQDRVPVIGCQGLHKEVRVCLKKPCPVIATTAKPSVCSTWGAWKEWRACSKPCGTGYQYRIRFCSSGISRCLGRAWEKRFCNTQNCSDTKDFQLSSGKPWMSKQEICKGNSMFAGDFDGDGKTDLLCFYPNRWITIFFPSSSGTFGNLNWSGWTSACSIFAAPGSVSIADVNGDGLDDFLCYDQTTGKMSVSFSTSNGFNEDVDLKLSFSDFCIDDGSSLMFFDVNGDKKADLICKSPLGFVSILHNTWA